MKLSEALAYRAKIETAASGIDDATEVESQAMFPLWVAGMSVSV